MGKKYGNFLGNVNWCIGQSGAMEKHFSDAIDTLKSLRFNIDKTRFLKITARNFKKANNAGRRVSQYLDKIKADIEKIKNDDLVDGKVKTNLVDFLRKIGTHEALINRETSFFIGHIGGDEKSLTVQLKLYRQGKQSKELVFKALDGVIKSIYDILGSNGKVGLLPFIVLLRNNLLPLAKKIDSIKDESNIFSFFKRTVPLKDEGGDENNQRSDKNNQRVNENNQRVNENNLTGGKNNKRKEA